LLYIYDIHIAIVGVGNIKEVIDVKTLEESG